MAALSLSSSHHTALWQSTAKLCRDTALLLCRGLLPPHLCLSGQCALIAQLKTTVPNPQLLQTPYPRSVILKAAEPQGHRIPVSGEYRHFSLAEPGESSSNTPEAQLQILAPPWELGAYPRSVAVSRTEYTHHRSGNCLLEVPGLSSEARVTKFCFWYNTYNECLGTKSKFKLYLHSQLPQQLAVTLWGALGSLQSRKVPKARPFPRS